jgi:hypothetical protein
MAVPISITQGQFYEDTINLTHTDGSAIDLTGATVISQIRRGPASLGYAILASFTVTISSPATSGVITRSLTGNQTAALPLPFPSDATFFHDIFVTTNGGEPLQVVSGTVSVSPNYSA